MVNTKQGDCVPDHLRPASKADIRRYEEELKEREEADKRHKTIRERVAADPNPLDVKGTDIFTGIFKLMTDASASDDPEFQAARVADAISRALHGSGIAGKKLEYKTGERVRLTKSFIFRNDQGGQERVPQGSVGTVQEHDPHTDIFTKGPFSPPRIETVLWDGQTKPLLSSVENLELV